MRNPIAALSLILLCAVTTSNPAIAGNEDKLPTLTELEADMASKIASKSPDDLAKMMAAMEFQRLKAVRNYNDQKKTVSIAVRATVDLRKELAECRAQ